MAVTFYYNKCKIQIFKVFAGTLDKTIMMHSHTKNGYELHLIDSGSGMLETVNGVYKLSKDTLYVTGPNVLHKQTPDEKDPMHELCVYFKIPGIPADIAVRAFASREFWIGKSNREIRGIFSRMVSENENFNSWRESVLASLAVRLITEMARLYFPGNTGLAAVSADDRDLNESRSWILDQLFQEDCSGVSLGDFAQKLGVSKRQAERIIFDHYGSSFKKLRYESKMAMAAILLEKSSISVEDCAARCGYSSASAFCVAFKRKFSVTPKEYRKTRS